MTLTELSYQSRIIAKLALLFVGGSLVFYVMMLLMIQLLQRPQSVHVTFKPAFGKLEAPAFEQAQRPKDLDFVLDTVDGTLPQTTPSGQIFFIPQKQATLLYLTRANALAQSFGIDTEEYPQQTVDDSWVRFATPSDELKVNTKYFHFNYTMNPTTALQQLIETTPSAKFTQLEDQFVQTAKDALLARSAYTPDVAAGKTNIVYLRYNLDAKQFYPITADEVPQAVRIDFFRKDELFSVVSPQYFVSQNYVILAPLTNTASAVAMQYKSYDVLRDTTGDYPLKSATIAWDELTSGEAAIISLQDNPTGTIRIKQIFLAYYDPESYQKYLQPVFVFLGDQNYVGYLPAVQSDYLIQLKSK
ncbi:MAG: hypothetical protein WC775_02920 [Patescibacteria group bacterium]|jgi:hypothetical protein